MSYEERRTDELAAHGKSLGEGYNGNPADYQERIEQTEVTQPEASRIDEADPSMHPDFHDARTGSLADLLRDISDEFTLLAQKEVELARTELRADLGAEIAAFKGMGISAFLAILGVNMLLVSLVFVLAPGIDRWVVALVMGLVLMLAAVVSGYIGWSRRVTRPLDTTVDSLKEDVLWAKESFT
jgi:uncharacterized membrane protein YqjE